MTELRRSGHEGAVERPASRDEAGSDRGFAELYRRYHGRVWRTLTCLGVPPHAREDALQEVFLVVHRRLGEPERYTSLKAWIYAVTRRVAWAHFRTRARRRRKLEALQRDLSLVSSEPAPDEGVARREANAMVMQFLDTLDDSQRAIFVLAELEGLAATEIAQIVDAKLNTVYSRLRLARRRFARALAAFHRRLERESGDA